MFALIICFFIGVAFRIGFESLGGGGGVAFRGTKKFDKYSKDADAKVKEILKNGTGSTKEELQDWWDTYHK